MKKSFYLVNSAIVILIIFLMYSCGSHKIVGKVVSENGDVVDGAEIIVADKELAEKYPKTLSDNKGIFVFEDVDEDTINFEINADKFNLGQNIWTYSEETEGDTVQFTLNLARTKVIGKVVDKKDGKKKCRNAVTHSPAVPDLYGRGDQCSPGMIKIEQDQKGGYRDQQRQSGKENFVFPVAAMKEQRCNTNCPGNGCQPEIRLPDCNGKKEHNAGIYIIPGPGWPGCSQDKDCCNSKPCQVIRDYPHSVGQEIERQDHGKEENNRLCSACFWMKKGGKYGYEQGRDKRGYQFEKDNIWRYILCKQGNEQVKTRRGC